MYEGGVNLVKFELETGKTVELSEFKVSAWGVFSFEVVFMELNQTRTYKVDIEALEGWLSAKGKTLDNFTKKDVKDFLVERLLPLYNRLEKTKRFRDRIKGF